MNEVFVGFDSAWAERNKGIISYAVFQSGVLEKASKSRNLLRSLTPPKSSIGFRKNAMTCSLRLTSRLSFPPLRQPVC